jgi:hypothetical protein
MSYLAFRVPSKASLPPGSPSQRSHVLGVILPTVGRFSLYKRKYSVLWLMHNPEPHVEQLRDSAYSMPVYTFINELHYQ